MVTDDQAKIEEDQAKSRCLAYEELMGAELINAFNRSAPFQGLLLRSFQYPEVVSSYPAWISSPPIMSV